MEPCSRIHIFLYLYHVTQMAQFKAICVCDMNATLSKRRFPLAGGIET
jgi:hypothetical protein